MRRALDRCPGLQYHRIELRMALSDGFPDLMLAHTDIGVFFVENKFGHDLREWRPNQRRWAKNKEAIGVKCFVFVANETQSWLVRSKDNFDHNKIIKPLFVCNKSIDPIVLMNSFML